MVTTENREMTQNAAKCNERISLELTQSKSSLDSSGELSLKNKKAVQVFTQTAIASFIVVIFFNYLLRASLDAPLFLWEYLEK